jgi:hypothetical protein
MPDFEFDYDRLYSLGTTPALDYLYAMMDSYLLAKRYDLVEEVMAKIDLDRGKSAIACGVLTITLPWDKELPGRRAFFRRAKAYYQTLEKDADSILAGLESYQPTPGIPSLRDWLETRASASSRRRP